MAKLFIDRLLAGQFTGIDLVESTATVEFVTNAATILSKKVLFDVLYEWFSFSLKFDLGVILLERCGNSITHKITTLDPTEKIKIKIVFEPNKMGLLVGDKKLFEKLITFESDEKEKFLLSQYSVVEYQPVLPPNSMFPWLRKQYLLPKAEFNNYEEFLDAVAVMLVSIEPKIETSNMFVAFWNSLSKKDTEALPKKEVDIHPTLLGIIQDECLVKGLEINHESTAGSGSLDFYISGYIKNIGMKGTCVEVKHAHSSKLEYGIKRQLPSYMKSKESDFGFYLVLWFKGERFDKPVEYEDKHKMEDCLRNIRNSIGYGRSIRILTLDLSG